MPPIKTPTKAPATGGMFKLLETLMPNVASATGDITLFEAEDELLFMTKCCGDSSSIVSRDWQ